MFADIIFIYHFNFFRWEAVVECSYSLIALKETADAIAPRDEILCTQLQDLPPTWTLENDEDLAQFLTSFIQSNNENLGSIKSFVEHVAVSSSCVCLIGFSFVILYLLK